MKVKLLLLFTLLCFFEVSNAWILPQITVTWTTLNSWSWWKLVFPNSSNWVIIDTQNYASNSSSDLSINWNFWLQNLADSSDQSSWWVTFDIWNVSWAPKVVLKNNWDNTFTFEWYAWSKSVWWIYFWDTWITDWKVVYNRWTQRINWCAFSQNIWWVCIDNFFLDTTPPDLNSVAWQNVLKPSEANHSKSLTAAEWISKVILTNWSSVSTTTYFSQTFTHDFRKAKTYDIDVYDTTWNNSTSTIKIVAWVPTETLNSNHIWVTSASEFSKTPWSKIWDWNDKHTINFSLKDKYWNPVINESWIKDVKVFLGLDNKVDKDQVSNIINMWNAISYSDNSGLNLMYLTNYSTWYNSTAVYNIDLKSLAPSKSWYNYTSNDNDIKISDLRITITALSWNYWVWEVTNPNMFYSNYYNSNFDFTPVVKLETLSNDRNFVMLRDAQTSFSWSMSINKTTWSSNVSDIKILNKLDTFSWWTNRNYNVSFQNISWNNQLCRWFLKPNQDNTSFSYDSNSSYCNLEFYPNNNTSNIAVQESSIFTNNLSTIEYWFTATPKVVIPWLTSFDLRFASEIDYNIWSDNIKYPSYAYNYWNSLANNEIKITWITNANNNFSVIQTWSLNEIWKLDKMTVYTNIKKKTKSYSLVWTWSNWVYYTKSNYNLNSWPSWINTIIVEWADIVIWWDIYKESWKVKTIIALKNWDTWWNIWVKDNVNFIWAILITDKSIISWDWTNYYSDNASWLNQLFIKWSILSYNTIWWSSSTTTKCPYYVETCTELTSKRYDLNNFRYFVFGQLWTPVNWTTFWVNMNLDWYKTSPIIVEYDQDVQVNPPSILTE